MLKQSSLFLLVTCHILTGRLGASDKLKLLKGALFPNKQVTTPTPNSAATENPFLGRNNRRDLAWIDEAIKDVAYYLRAHKFNDYDRRYETKPNKSKRVYFSAFPRPPLRSLHWEVHRYCEPSFVSCVDYLRKKVARADLKRSDDSSYVIQQQKWNTTNHTSQINSTEMECRKMLKTDNRLANPFEGPIERFQWRVTASYYMCWYTMNKVPDLKHFDEPCDNFANCLDPDYGTNNGDPRADDKVPFACSLYSFCPDSCCPFKHLRRQEDCWNRPENPCYRRNPVGDRMCSFNLSKNTEFRDIVLNRWNVTCKCQEKGFDWSSRYGICVDIDECTDGSHNCESESEACVNLIGDYTCACKWGHGWYDKTQKCQQSAALSVIKRRKSEMDEKQAEKKAGSIVKKLYYSVFGEKSSAWAISAELSLHFQVFLLGSLYYKQM